MGAGKATFTAKLHIPSNAADGNYALALWLPDDEAESLQNNPEYAIQFANENVWDEATGFNVLGNVFVTKSAGGKVAAGKDFIVLSANPVHPNDKP